MSVADLSKVWQLSDLTEPTAYSSQYAAFDESLDDVVVRNIIPVSTSLGDGLSVILHGKNRVGVLTSWNVLFVDERWFFVTEVAKSVLTASLMRVRNVAAKRLDEIIAEALA